MPNYFINTYCIESKFQRKIFGKFKDVTASYEFTKIGKANRELLVFSPSV